ncbi:hypothetical protein ABT052_29015 [Streptomyces sp. NPDC002766]|uniref:hypothetical protein n=1 Tax=Streptomyces sp. NPDC002766 TaxID=3154429 RepID=UPI00331CCFE6
MSACSPRTALLVLATVPVAAALALKAGHFRLTCSWHGIWLEPLPHPDCADCHGAGGRWTPGHYPEMEACWCWAERPERSLRLLPFHTPCPDESPI